MIRYFASTPHEILEIEQLIKEKKTQSNVFQVVVRDAHYIKSFTWMLIKNDINFSRKPLGSGIVNFFIDMSTSFFLTEKK